MEVIVELRPACRASLPHRHTPITPSFRYPPPISVVDLLLSSIHVFIVETFAPGTNCSSTAEYGGERGLAQRPQSQWENAYA
jgi:hypothetical protein